MKYKENFMGERQINCIAFNGRKSAFCPSNSQAPFKAHSTQQLRQMRGRVSCDIAIKAHYAIELADMTNILNWRRGEREMMKKEERESREKLVEEEAFFSSSIYSYIIREGEEALLRYPYFKLSIGLFVPHLNSILGKN